MLGILFFAYLVDGLVTFIGQSNLPRHRYYMRDPTRSQVYALGTTTTLPFHLPHEFLYTHLCEHEQVHS